MSAPSIEEVEGLIDQSSIKIARLVMAAKANNWHGQLKSKELPAGRKLSRLTASRNQEIVIVRYIDNQMAGGSFYSLYGMERPLYSPGIALNKLKGWPDLVKTLDRLQVPELHLKAIEELRRLPFEEDDSSEFIVNSCLGQPLQWYSKMHRKVVKDVVTFPTKSNSKQFKVVKIGDRRMFHFIGKMAGFRSVMLDTICKVG